MAMRRPRRGSVNIIVVGALIAILGMCTLSVDMGMVTLARQQLQAAADAAALSAATTLRLGMDRQAAIDAAVSVAADHVCLKQPVVMDPATDVEVGVWNSATGQVDDWFASNAGEVAAQGGTLAVRVTARRTANCAAGPVPMFFARALGMNSVDVQASAIGGLEVRRRERPPVEIVVVQDYSGSFGVNDFNSARNASSGFVRIVGDASKAADKIGYVGFSDEVITSGNYPEAGWPKDPAIQPASMQGYYDWQPTAGLLARNYPQALTDITDPSLLTNVKNRFSSTSGITFFSAGSNDYPLYRPSTQTYYTSSTNTAAALRYATDMFLGASGTFNNPAAEHVVVLLTDGMPLIHNPSAALSTWYWDKWDARYPRRVPPKVYAWSKAQTVLAADYLASRGVRLHTVTYCKAGFPDGLNGSDADFNASITRNGGYAFVTADPQKLADLMVGVATIEIGQASLIR